jgi:hypothetical protein
MKIRSTGGSTRRSNFHSTLVTKYTIFFAIIFFLSFCYYYKKVLLVTLPKVRENFTVKMNSCVKDYEMLISLADNDIIKSNLNKETETKLFVDKAVQVNNFEEFNSFDVSDIINTDFKLQILTGIHNLALLNMLVCTYQKP